MLIRNTTVEVGQDMESGMERLLEEANLKLESQIPIRLPKYILFQK